jgi:hypothetical protein
VNIVPSAIGLKNADFSPHYEEREGKQASQARRAAERTEIESGEIHEILSAS